MEYTIVKIQLVKVNFTMNNLAAELNNPILMRLIFKTFRAWEN